MESNLFFRNNAFFNGAALYILNSSSTIIINNNSFSENSVIQSTFGSILNLKNPGNLTISNSTFNSNQGVLGTAIYYDEESKN